MNGEMSEVETTANAELDAVRQVVLAAYPDSVPELIQGATVPELLASIEPARAAYARVAETVIAPAAPVAVSAPVVPAGGGSAAIDPGALPAAEKVRRGIAGQRR
jgi:predicted anti-sigma-YlaC factor YlaD